MGAQVRLVVLHYTVLNRAETLARLCDPVAQVSAHYVIDTLGEVIALVPEDRRAWHAGAGRWGAISDVNSASIGIELVNDGQSPFAAPQMRALETLLPEILARHAIPPAGVIGHSDMAPARKADPGARFDWARLARKGLSVWPEGQGGAEDFLSAATRFGYDPDLSPDLILRAFRLRFRPWASGPLSEADRIAASALARRYPVDLPAPRA